MRASLIIAAGGLGSRFRETLKKSKAKFPSKLFFPLQGKPVLSWCLDSFQKFPEISETLISVPAGTEPEVQKLVREKGWRGVKVLEGGGTRAESVWKALRKSDPKNGWVMVHDGARPFVEAKAIDKMFTAAKNADGAILARKVVPTIKQADEKHRIVRTIDRSSLYEAETPQLVRRDLLTKAFEALPDPFTATDEASMLEAINAKVKIVTHDGWNPKITSFKDWELAEAYLGKNAETRTGFGRDTHRLVEGRKFMLGGIRIPFDKGPLGHSDGDALLHAITDAVLGATGAGDIGEWFSDKDNRNKNIDSSRMLAAVLEDAQSKGWQIKHIDSVIILERPKLGPYKQKMKEKIAKIAGIPADAVSVKAKTAEGLGPEGEGKAIACEALVSVKRINL